jgi:hypothetical protein
MTPLMNRLTHSPGFALHRLRPDELTFVRGLITEQYLERLARLQPELVETARRIGIANYHLLPISFDHGSSWPKATRLLDPIHVKRFSEMAFFETIREQIGPTATISHDELNWRLVRPHQPNDVGPLHADKWFWDGGYGQMPPGYERFKIWIAIHTEPGSNGLKVLADSHRREWLHHFEMRDGVNKPIFDEPEPEIPLLPLAPGEMVMFHDELLHGGAVNPGKTCRVSIELTVLFDPREACRLAA